MKSGLSKVQVQIIQSLVSFQDLIDEEVCEKISLWASAKNKWNQTENEKLYRFLKEEEYPFSAALLREIIDA